MESAGRRKRKLGPIYNGECSKKRGSIVADKISTSISRQDELCARCTTIDFEEISRRKILTCGGIFVLDLGSAASWEPSTCPLCRLFDATPVQLDHGYDTHGSLQLWAFSMNHIYGRLRAPEFLALTDANLIGIVRKHSSVTRCSTRSYLLESTELLYTEVISGWRQDFAVRRLDPKIFDKSMAREWWKYCCKNHGEVCGVPNTAALRSLKVIDCDTREIVEAPPNCRYAALSYVWGRSTKDDTKTWRSSEATGETVLLTLPKTIEDSIQVTKDMGLQFLWVDRYCIDQTDKEDKYCQIQQMDDIYSSAELTIIAAAGSDPNHGLPGINETSRSPQEILRLDNCTLIRTWESAQQSVPRSPWAHRGWTYQEGILSRRRLIFTEQQVFFECNRMQCAESVKLPLDLERRGRVLGHAPTELLKEEHRGSVLSYALTGILGRVLGLAPTRLFGKERPGFRPEMFMYHVVRINERRFSNPEDVLNAMVGIFKAFEKAAHPVMNITGVPIFSEFLNLKNPAPYHSGISAKSCFLRGLFWRHFEAGRRRKSFPSWSWAGWRDGTISEYLDFHDFSSLRWGDVEIWLETSNGQLHGFPANDRLLDFVSSLRENPRYIHLNVWTIPCSIQPSKAGTRRIQWKGDDEISGNHIQIASADVQFDQYEPPNTAHTCEDVRLRPVYAAIFLFSDQRRAYLLIVQDKGLYFERVACASFEISEEWDRKPKVRRTLRLG